MSLSHPDPRCAAAGGTGTETVTAQASSAAPPTQGAHLGQVRRLHGWRVTRGECHLLPDSQKINSFTLTLA